MVQPVFESVETFTPDEFARWVEDRSGRGDQNRYELLHGRIVMMPPAGWPHGHVGSTFGAALAVFVRPRGTGLVFTVSQGFELPSGDTVDPDVAFVSKQRWEKAPPPRPAKFLRVVPDLVGEILSPSTASRDQGEKRAIYESSGVREYWLIDPHAFRVTVLCLQRGRLKPVQTLEGGGAASSTVLRGFEIALSDLFADCGLPVAARGERTKTRQRRKAR